MTIVNRRNALIGWAVWNLGKRVAKRKAKSAVPGIDAETKRPNASAMALGVAAAVGGAVLLWRLRGAGDDDDDSMSIG